MRSVGVKVINLGCVSVTLGAAAPVDVALEAGVVIGSRAWLTGIFLLESARFTGIVLLRSAKVRDPVLAADKLRFIAGGLKADVGVLLTLGAARSVAILVFLLASVNDGFGLVLEVLGSNFTPILCLFKVIGG